MTEPARTRPRHWIACIAIVVLLGALNAACARATKTIAFQGDSNPPKTGIIVELDIIFTKVATQEGAQYPFDTATKAPFIRFQIAEVGTVASYTLKIHPIEPGQTVACIISIDRLVVDQDSATYPKFAICKGPPV